MNKKQKKDIDQLVLILQGDIDDLSDLCFEFDAIVSDETQKLENLPDSLSESDMAISIQDGIDSLGDISCDLDIEVSNLVRLNKLLKSLKL